MQSTGLRARNWSLLVLPLFLLGCEGTDPTGSGSLSGAEAEALFQEVADAGTVRLPSATHLLHQLRSALRAGPPDASVRALLEEHEAVRRAARLSLEEGDASAARLLVEQARHLHLEILIAVLGTGLVDRTVSSVEDALHQLRARIEGRWIPRPLTARLDAVSLIVANARAALSSGDPLTALSLALRAAEGLRSLSPEAFSVRADAAIERATGALEGALALVGDRGVEPRAAEALERAALFLDRAHWSLENGAYAAALELALTSIQHSSRAIQLSRRGVDPVS